ncbi:histidine phosphatase superfamily clade-1 [Fadolivirus algeromassiliense]|jgi:broad specificity phosphatase PhoE|uniref:Histidine phosphatase superfamily clade-1 n=1 Tax=Fadolivirus FV1/VV64 TaxID=3070911 RepID=A0A7D3UQT3_9VIRU|nr:histidine phosphatase superfamily clade-1 [Fadolivirus algeromassiliense]QKF94688.1 histidine phosphatase superfamily clade-1 [Fadolivirus FV1/VV64]
MKQYIKYIYKHNQNGGNNKSDNINIKFYFVRHAYSCSNLKSTEADRSNPLNKLISILQKIYEQDPNLTQYGINHSKKFGNEIKSNNLIGHIDYLFSSSLARAIETAHLMFNKEITIAPYLREKGYTYNNIPFDPNDQDNNRIRLFNELQHTNVDIRRIHENDINRGYQDDKEGYNGNLYKFIEWFLNTYYDEIKNKQTINVVAVTHSRLMQHDFEDFVIVAGKEIKSFRERKPYNNSVYKLELNIPKIITPNIFDINNDILTLSNNILIVKELIEIHNGIKDPDNLPNQYCELICTFYQADKCNLHDK